MTAKITTKKTVLKNEVIEGMIDFMKTYKCK